MKTMNSPTNIDQYIAGFPKHMQDILERLRTTIKKAAPDAEEKIGYGIPTFFLNGNLVHFGGYKNHIGFYPAPSGIEAFKKELSVFEGAKGSIKFPIDHPLPLDLISKIVKFRVQENLGKAGAKTKGTLKVCPNGHQYNKSSDCPTCPICEQERKPSDGFLSQIAAPARRALENKGISTLQQLSMLSEADILGLHGMGPASMPKLRSALKAAGLTLKKQ
ncbi:MAG: DUF1801 domain-containing protein [Ferruginibacter sp.]